MKFRRLKYFVKIVDIGSLTQAAEVLHIAQPRQPSRWRLWKRGTRSAAVESVPSAGSRRRKRVRCCIPTRVRFCVSVNRRSWR
ncbi:LysR family transcriptional regulator [Escherichia coli]